MRYSMQPKEQKHVKRYSFLSFLRKCGDKFGRKAYRPCNKNSNLRLVI